MSHHITGKRHESLETTQPERKGDFTLRRLFIVKEELKVVWTITVNLHSDVELYETDSERTQSVCCSINRTVLSLSLCLLCL